MKRKIFTLLGLLMISASASGSVTVIDYLYRQCDVNQDGTVTASDVTAIYDYLLGASGNNLLCDTNHDGYVTAADVTLIYDVLLGKSQYVSISDAFDLNLEYLDIDDGEYHDWYHFYWDDVAAENGVTTLDYMLLLSTESITTYQNYYCSHSGTNENNIQPQDITEWLQYKFHWNNPEDVPENLMDADLIKSYMNYINRRHR